MKWQLKVAVQAVLAHVPGGEAVNHRLQRAVGHHTPEAMRSAITTASAKGSSSTASPDLEVACGGRKATCSSATSSRHRR